MYWIMQSRGAGVAPIYLSSSHILGKEANFLTAPIKYEKEIAKKGLIYTLRYLYPYFESFSLYSEESLHSKHVSRTISIG